MASERTDGEDRLADGFAYIHGATSSISRR